MKFFAAWIITGAGIRSTTNGSAQFARKSLADGKSKSGAAPKTTPCIARHPAALPTSAIGFFISFLILTGVRLRRPLARRKRASSSLLIAENCISFSEGESQFRTIYFRNLLGFFTRKTSVRLLIVRSLESVFTVLVRNLSEQERLEVLRQMDPARQWYSIRDKRVCMICEKIINGSQIRISGEPGAYVLHCPTEGCPSDLRHWWFPHQLGDAKAAARRPWLA